MNWLVDVKAIDAADLGLHIGVLIVEVIVSVSQKRSSESYVSDRCLLFLFRR